MGFFDSFKVGLSGVADFLTDITGAALAAAPTIIPILQSTGVIPQIQPQFSGGFTGQLGPARRTGPVFAAPRPGPTALPGGAFVPFPTAPRVNPAARNIPLANLAPFPTGFPSDRPFSPGGVGMPILPSTRAGFSQAGFLDLPLIDIVGQGGGSQLARLTSPFIPTQAGARAQPFVSANPVSGKLTWFKPAGQPILWSGDLTACKRVGRIARRARRARPR